MKRFYQDFTQKRKMQGKELRKVRLAIIDGIQDITDKYAKLIMTEVSELFSSYGFERPVNETECEILSDIMRNEISVKRRGL